MSLTQEASFAKFSKFGHKGVDTAPLLFSLVWVSEASFLPQGHARCATLAVHLSPRDTNWESRLLKPEQFFTK